MAKNPFKKTSIIDTVVNVGIGGAANVAIDYVVGQVDAVKELGDTTINAIKIAAGAIVGSMVKNKVARAACDGIATVGVSNLVSGLMTETSPTSGLPYGTISGRVIPGRAISRRVVPGNKAYRRARRTRGTAGAPNDVMGK